MAKTIGIDGEQLEDDEVLDDEEEWNGDDDEQRPSHEVLEVAPDASPEQIKAAWRKKIQLYHRDKVETLAPEFKELAERKSKELNAAYEDGKAKHAK